MLDIYIEEVLTDEMSMKNSLLNIDLVEMHLVFSKRYGKTVNVQAVQAGWSAGGWRGSGGAEWRMVGGN